MNADLIAKLVEKFAVAAQDRLERLNNGLLTLERSPEDDETIEEVMREIHTLKGESKMLGLEATNVVAHTTEDHLISAKEAGFQVDGDALDLIYEGFDLLAELIEVGAGEVGADLQGQVRAYVPAERVPEAWGASGDAGSAAPDPDPAQEPSAESAAAAEAPEPDAAPDAAPDADGASTASAASPPPKAANTNTEGASKRNAAAAFLRVSTEQMEHLTRLGGDLQLLHADSERLSSDMERLVGSCRGALPKVKEAIQKADGSTNEALVRHLVALYDEMDSHLRKFRDASFQSRVRVGELQEEVSNARMQEINTLLQKYPRAVRDLAKELGKRARVEVDDGGIRADDDVLRSLADPLLHIIRNAVDHGLEDPATRAAAGKDEEGTLQLIARRVGTRIELQIIDDGGGIDADKVRAVAVKRGVVSEAEAAALSEADARSLLFRPGFSTAEKVTDVSGRGVGLDVVRTHIERLGGTVVLESELGKGTTFTLRIPTTVALTPVLVVQLDQGQFGLPSSDVEAVLRVASSDLVHHAGTHSLRLTDDQRVPLLDLAAELGFPSSDLLPSILHAVVIGNGEDRVALRVRRLVGERPAVQAALNPLLAGYASVTGTAILEGGQVLPVLNSIRLLEATKQEGRRPGAIAATAPSKPTVSADSRLRVLLVEDSDLTREMLIAAVGRLGYEVLDAANGRQGVDTARARTPDVIMTDLDMPVLNGCGLIEELRGDPSFAETPIVVFSTRSSDADRKKAFDLGADGYLVKAQFSDGRLREFIADALASRATKAAA